MRIQLIKSFLLVLLAFTSIVTQAAVVVKIATIAPKDSVWHMYLKQVNQRWQEVSAGQVELRIYAGTLGDEDDIMRRIRIGQLDAAMISSAGLASIDEKTQAMHIPLAFSSNAEMEYVRDGIARILEPIFSEKGFKVLAWGEAGWVYFFTKLPVSTPDDLKKLKLFIWSNGDSTQEEKLWQEFGFNTVPLSSIDIMPALQTGMINAYQAPPLVSLANQWFPFTPYMTNLKWAPMTGVTMISQKAWKKIPAEFREAFDRIVKEEGLILQQQVRELEQQAIDAMTSRGLEVVTVDASATEDWVAMVKRGYPKIRGQVVPVDIFDEALRLRDEFRSVAKGH